eukprot:3141716-Pyramimonas_sp.AAC.1
MKTRTELLPDPQMPRGSEVRRLCLWRSIARSPGLGVGSPMLPLPRSCAEGASGEFYCRRHFAGGCSTASWQRP